MSFFGILDTILGGVEIAAGALTANPMLIAGGIGMTISGIGSIIEGTPHQGGISTTERGSIEPFRVVYGRAEVGGTLVYCNTYGDNNQMLDMIMVLACHPCESVDEVLFDGQRVMIDTNAVPTSAKAGFSITPPLTGSGTSFTPVQQNVDITHISRDSNGIVTVELPANIPYLTAGDRISIHGITGDESLNGTFTVAQIISQVFGDPGSVTFTYLSGGSPSIVDNEGQATTLWADYRRNVYFEWLNGSQTLGETFTGETAGTPWQGTGKLTTPASPQNAGGPSQPNQWTAFCSLAGFTCVFLRLQYDQKIFANGMPQITFRMHGKNDIYDPRTSTYGYTENAALCIADFLNQGCVTGGSDPSSSRSRIGWGFKASYGTEISVTQLEDAANVCDTTVPSLVSVSGTEPQWACNGQFTLDMKRGEVLQNLLTSCAGRLVYSEGQFVIQPAQWVAPISTPYDLFQNAVGNPIWKPTVSTKDLYNSVRGTYISQLNSYKSTDFPPYQQDWNHGYDPGHTLTAFQGDANLEADGGDRRWFDMSLPFTISSNAAQRIAKVELLRRRHFGSGTFTCNMSAYQFVPLDVIQANFSPLSWSSKILEVSAVRLKVDKDSSSDVETPVLSCQLDLVETDSSIYTWSSEEELSPEGIVISNFPAGQVVETQPYPWSPGYTNVLTGDAIPTLPATFGVQPVYGLDAAGNGTISLKIEGTAPTNILADIDGPWFSCADNTTGGTLATGDYVVGISARDSGSSPYKLSDYLQIGHASVTGPTGSITVTINQWASGDDGGDLYVAQWVPGQAYEWHHNQALSSGATSATVTTFDQTTTGGIDTVFDHFSLIWQPIVHSGCFAQQVQAVTSSTITLNGPLSGFTSNQWAGYTLSLLAKQTFNVDVPIINMPVASNTASDSSGNYVLTIGTNTLGNTLPDLTTLLEVGDLLVMRFKPTFTSSSFSDSNINNAYFPGGAVSSDEVGNVAVVLSGPDAGDVQTISSVSSGTQFNLAGTWQITPNAGDLVIVCSPANVPEVLSSPIYTSATLTGTVMQPNIMNLSKQAWLFRVRTEDVNSNHCPDQYTPWRELFIFGTQGVRLITASSTQLITDGQVLCDTTSGDITFTLLQDSTITGVELTIAKVSSDSNTVTITCNPSDDFSSGGTTLTLDGANQNVVLQF